MHHRSVAHIVISHTLDQVLVCTDVGISKSQKRLHRFGPICHYQSMVSITRLLVCVFLLGFVVSPMAATHSMPSGDDHLKSGSDCTSFCVTSDHPATQACDQCFGHAMAPVPLFVGEQGQSQDLLVDVIGTPTMNLELNLPPPKTA